MAVLGDTHRKRKRARAYKFEAPPVDGTRRPRRTMYSGILDGRWGPSACHARLQGGGAETHAGRAWWAGHILSTIRTAGNHIGKGVWPVYQVRSPHQPACKCGKHVPTTDVHPHAPGHHRGPGNSATPAGNITYLTTTYLSDLRIF